MSEDRRTRLARAPRPLALVAALVVTSGGLLAGCADAPTGQARGAASATPSVVVYPAPGTAAVLAGGICQWASDTAIPMDKRRSFIAECADQLRRATDPVTKPVPQSPITTPSPAVDAPACRTAVLALDYYSGGPATGNDGGIIRVRNTGTSPCELRGPVKLIGSDSGGVPDTQSLTYDVVAHLVLTAQAARVPVGQSPPAGEVVALIELAAEYRDDPTAPNGLCSANRVIPAQWHLVFADAAVRRAPNVGGDPGYPEFASLITCRGQLGIAQPIGPDG